MKNLEIKDTVLENIDDLINLCIPSDKKDNPSFIEGIKLKRRWASQLIKKYGSIAKLAYTNSKPIGLIQYEPKPDENVVEIACIFVPDVENLRKEVGKSLFVALLKDMKKPKPYFNNKTAKAFVTWTFAVPGRYPQREFYLRMGFKEVKTDLLYYSIQEEYIFSPKEEKYFPQKDDVGKALIFFDPACPWSIYFSSIIEKFIREVSTNILIRMINKFADTEEIEKRGTVPFCAVNKKPIQTFFFDKENFQKEVTEALEFLT